MRGARYVSFPFIFFTLSIRREGPVVVSVSSDGAVFNSATFSPQTIFVTFNEDITILPSIKVAPDGGEVSVNDCSDADFHTFCFDYNIPNTALVTETITISGARYAESNIMNPDSTHSFVVDTVVAPLVGGGEGGGRARVIPGGSGVLEEAPAGVPTSAGIPRSAPVPGATSRGAQIPVLQQHVFDIVSKPAEAKQANVTPFFIFAIVLEILLIILLIFIARRVRKNLAIKKKIKNEIG